HLTMSSSVIECFKSKCQRKIKRFTIQGNIPAARYLIRYFILFILSVAKYSASLMLLDIFIQFFHLFQTVHCNLLLTVVNDAFIAFRESGIDAVELSIPRGQYSACSCFI